MNKKYAHWSGLLLLGYTHYTERTNNRYLKYVSVTFLHNYVHVTLYSQRPTNQRVAARHMAFLLKRSISISKSTDRKNCSLTFSRYVTVT